MTVLTGRVQKVQSKTWDDGNTSYSIHLNDAWYTNYAFDTKGQPAEGDTIEAIITTSKAGKEYIKDWQQANADTVPAPTPHTNGAAAHNSAPSAPTDDTWHRKDLNITCQSVFKALCAANAVMESDTEELAKTAFKIAKYWDKAIVAYVAGADIGALKKNLADEVAEDFRTAPPTAEQAQDISNAELTYQDIPF